LQQGNPWQWQARARSLRKALFIQIAPGLAKNFPKMCPDVRIQPYFSPKFIWIGRDLTFLGLKPPQTSAGDLRNAGNERLGIYI